MSIKSSMENFILAVFSKNVSKINRLFLLKMSETLRLKQRKHLRLDVHLADHCNLNCKGCEHLSPLADEQFLDTETFEQDCKRLSELTQGHIAELSLLGGEPLLHPRITDLVEIARRYFPKGRIQIATNGICLPKQSALFWNTLQKHTIRLCITVYPIKIDHTIIKQLGQQYGVEIIYWGNLKQRNKVWEKMPIDISGGQNSIESFKQCYAANYCFQLVEGRIYPCFRVAYIKYFNRQFKTDLQIGENDYIDIYKSKNIEEILSFLCKPIPFCRYCNMKTVQYIDWAVSKKEITEWV